MDPFQFARTPVLLFGNGRIGELARRVGSLGARRIVLCTSGSFRRSSGFHALERGLNDAQIDFHPVTVSGEPSVELVDDTVAHLSRDRVDAVVSIGGGSVIDAGKAIAAMLTEEGSVEQLLEEVGIRAPSGKKLPFVAVPTTAGTGSEATKNAVISRVGAGGFKKSLRHDNFVPELALLDPELTASCTPEVTAASGMDAVTQLLEGFVATNASPLTDAHARTGLALAGASLERAVADGRTDLAARGDMALAAYLSGVVLANAGLGVVHGVASPAGGLHHIPHGVVCANLVGEASRTIIAELEANASNERDAAPSAAASSAAAARALAKYAEAGALLAGRDAGSVEANCRLLVETLERWLERFHTPRLGRFGIDAGAARRIANASSGKNSPVRLAAETIYDIIEARL